MKVIKHLFVLLTVLGVAQGCNSGTAVAKPAKEVDWKTNLKSVLPLLGHRNWILIVDKAFPMQNGSGITYINSNEMLLPVLTFALAEINNSTHIKPIIYQDKELSYITEDQSKGVKQLAESIKQVLGRNKAQQIPHDSVFMKIDEAAKLFNVFVIKTNETIPYSSVFLQLDCAYWNAEKEAALRGSMIKR
ncbi:MAG: hypothetical protein EAY75_09765 [Bacteroidetes bacterium]|nr:MAG: hypothetical protein EAY75_09765 [Bacteroidota bacterium]